jgi:hypothetical protein
MQTSMKKLLFVFLLGVMVLPEQVSAAPSASTEVSVQDAASKRRNKGYRKKKGFLWGLFKKKDKGCGCPSYK